MSEVCQNRHTSDKTCTAYFLAVQLQDPLQLEQLVQPQEQEPEQPLHPEQLPTQVSQPIGCLFAAFTIVGALANMMAPRIGSAPLAAFLKNSRRDWSSSFLFSFFILKSVVHQLYPEDRCG